MPYSSKLSSKSQIVIPRALREQSGLRPGDKVVLDWADGFVTVMPYPRHWAQSTFGLGRNLWQGVNVNAYVRGIRKEWERGRRRKTSQKT